MSTTSDNKPKGWFSRRHQTRAEHDKAVETRNALSGPFARRERAAQRAIEFGNVTPKQQLDFLDEHRFRATKERAKLERRMAAEPDDAA